MTQGERIGLDLALGIVGFFAVFGGIALLIGVLEYVSERMQMDLSRRRLELPESRGDQIAAETKGE